MITSCASPGTDELWKHIMTICKIKTGGFVVKFFISLTDISVWWIALCCSLSLTQTQTEKMKAQRFTFFIQQMEVDHHLIKDCHSSNKKPGGSPGSKLLYQATAGKDMTVRGLCDEAELCRPLNVTPFFPSEWKKNKYTTKNSCTRSDSLQHGAKEV